MALLRVFKRIRKNEGMALFFVIIAMTMLSILVTELTYVTSVNNRIAYDGLDQTRALALAKTGFKISLLRLKAFKTLQNVGQSAGVNLPKGMLDKIWSFPFFYPIPTQIPGLSPLEKDSIEKFQKESSLEGSFTAIIEAESTRYNLNSILPGFTISPSGSSTDTSTGTGTGTGTDTNLGGGTGTGTDTSTSTSTDAFDAEAAKKSLQELLTSTLEQKFQENPDLGADYRDLRVEDLMDAILTWSDPSHEKKNTAAREPIKPKGAPFFSISELRMLEQVDDTVFDWLAPQFTASATPGININTIQGPLLQGLFPGITEDEIKAFFKFRDDPEADNLFKKDDDFLKWMTENVGTLRGNTPDKLKQEFTKRQIRLITTEESFKITVTAQVNSTQKVLEAHVLLLDPDSPAAAVPGAPGAPGSAGGSANPANPVPTNKAGIRVIFMRFL